jgi:GGDEF domain-containing protein
MTETGAAPPRRLSVPRVKVGADRSDVLGMALDASQVVPIDASRTYESLFDAETRLPGWVLLLDRTTVALTRATRNGTQVLVAVIHRPRDQHGRRADMLETANAIRRQLRRDDTIARVDRDTLIVVCNDLEADTDAAQVARRFVANTHLTCDIGIALSGGHDDARSLLDLVVRDAHDQPLAV